MAGALASPSCERCAGLSLLDAASGSCTRCEHQVGIPRTTTTIHRRKSPNFHGGIGRRAAAPSPSTKFTNLPLAAWDGGCTKSRASYATHGHRPTAATVGDGCLDEQMRLRLCCYANKGDEYGRPSNPKSRRPSQTARCKRAYVADSAGGGKAFAGRPLPLPINVTREDDHEASPRLLRTPALPSWAASEATADGSWGGQLAGGMYLEVSG
jgi:hypothetical protein